MKEKKWREVVSQLKAKNVPVHTGRLVVIQFPH